MHRSDNNRKSVNTDTAHVPPRGRISERVGEKRPATEDVQYVNHPSFLLPDTERRLWGPERTRIHVSPYRLFPANPDETPPSPQSPRKPSVLTATEEETLFLRYNYAKHRLCQLVGVAATGSKRTLRRQKRLWRRRARRVYEKIVHANLSLAPAMTKRYRNSGVELGDLISEGQMAVLRCIDKFDVSRGFKFSTYACRAIIACFQRAAAKERRYRQHVPVNFKPSMERSDEARRRDGEQRAYAVADVREAVLGNRAGLSSLEEEVLLGRFPLRSEASGLTLKQLGKRMGLSRERIRQIEGRSLSKVRETLKEHAVA